MPYCRNCGRPLQDGEICGCTQSAQGAPVQQPNNYAAPQNGQPYNGGMQPPPYPNNGQPYPKQPYPNQPYPQGYPVPSFGQQMAQPPKKSNAWILAIIIPLACVIVLVLAAILVPAMLGYTKRSKQSSAFSKANTLRKAAVSSLVDLDEKGQDVKGYYIISSDKSKNRSVSIDLDEFNKKVEDYFPEVKDYEYFIVCCNGDVEYAAISDSWSKKSDYIGTFPGGVSAGIRKYSPDGSTQTVDGKTSLDDLYQYATRQSFLDYLE